ncbi:hypothetical protein BG003_011161 [Podila horticola]|nr:hypothetical protein BG003_011161 [Podila horticola]
MTDNHTNLLALFCVVDGESVSNAFKVEAASAKSVFALKNLIKAGEDSMSMHLSPLEPQLQYLATFRIILVLARRCRSTSASTSKTSRTSCGKTRAVIELLSQHWGFYFNASSDDWGSSDVITLHSTIRDYLNDIQESSTADPEANNACHLLVLVRDMYTEARNSIIKHGCLPKIKEDIRLLLIHDEAQVLCDAFNASFQLMSSSDESPRSLLSPI